MSFRSGRDGDVLKAYEAWRVAAAGSLVYFAATRFFKFPFVADDYIFLAKSYTTDFRITDVWWLSKRPLAAWLNFLSFKFHLFERSQLLFIFYFFFHAVGLLQVFRWITLRLQPIAINLMAWQVAGFVALLYPCFHEILYMATDLPWGLGIFFLGMGLWAKHPAMRFTWYLASFLCLEAYVGLALLLEFLRSGQGRRRMVADLVPFGAALFAYFVASWFIATKAGGSAYGIEAIWPNLPERLIGLTKILWTIHFYKERWLATAVEVGVCLFLTGYAAKTRSMGRWVLLASPLLFLMAGSPSLLLSYYAPRAAYGGAILKLVFLVSLLMSFLGSSARGWMKFAVTVLLAGTYVSQLALVFYTKNYNFHVLSKREVELRGLIENCAVPCVVEVPDLGAGLKRDWVMPAFSFEPFAQWVHRKYFPGKEVVFHFKS